MKTAVKILKLLKTEGPLIRPFGLFHIISLLFILFFTLLLTKKGRAVDEKKARRIILIISLIALVLELYKQIVYSAEINDKGIEWRYKWHIFPWQFCSTPIPAGLAAALIKNKKLHKAFCAYLASYSLLAGLVISLFPYSVYSSIIGINIQTTYCHGSMVVLGIFLLRSGYIKSSLKSFCSGVGVFLLGAAVALVLNEAAHIIGIPEGEVFDMYFISPYFPEDVPILAPIRRIIPDPFFQAAYLALFTAAAYLVMRLASKRKFQALGNRQ